MVSETAGMVNGTLHEVADGCFGYVQRDGGWGWSNAGLIVGDGTSLCVDTLYDLALTQAMLDAYAPLVAGAPIDTVVNTHANGDHCYGNQLLADRRILATPVTRDDMVKVPPSMMVGLANAPGRVGEVFRAFFGDFDFHHIELPPVTDTFTGALTLDVGGRTVELVDLGPAHTDSDVIAWVPDTRVVYTGDLLFSKGTPLAWAGPLANWRAALAAIIALDPAVVVPGHGPITDLDGVREMDRYLEWVDTEARDRHGNGMNVREAIRDIELGSYREWPEFGRLAINVEAVYKELDGRAEIDVVELFTTMADLESL
jgi:cyclase